MKSVYASGTLDHKQHFYYNAGWQLLEVRKETSGTEDSDPLEQYVWDPGYIDAPVLRDYDADTNGSSDRHYYTYDANYNVTAVTDDTGTVLERYHYTPFGETEVLDADFSDDADGASDIDNRVTFTGRRLDEESGLQYFRHRYHHPQLGNFTSRDPLGYVDGMSLYGNYFSPGGVDPMGLAEGWEKSGQWHYIEDIDYMYELTNDQWGEKKRLAWRKKVGFRMYFIPLAFWEGNPIINFDNDVMADALYEIAVKEQSSMNCEDTFGAELDKIAALKMKEMNDNEQLLRKFGVITDVGGTVVTGGTAIVYKKQLFLAVKGKIRTRIRCAIKNAASRAGKITSRDADDMITLYRGDRSGLTTIQSKEARKNGLSASQLRIDTEDIDDMMRDHAISSDLPPSPFISLTEDRRMHNFMQEKVARFMR